MSQEIREEKENVVDIGPDGAEKAGASHASAYLADEGISVRFPYMVGVAMVAGADGEISVKKRASLNKLALSLGLVKEQFARILKTAAEADSETLDSIIEALDKKEQQIVFILDLHSAGWQNDRMGPSAQKMTGLFADMLKIGSYEQDFLQAFAEAELNGDTAKAKEAVAAAKEIGLSLNVDEILKGDWQNLLGNYYYHGSGVGQDYAEAVKWYRKAAEQGNEAAKKRLQALS